MQVVKQSRGRDIRITIGSETDFRKFCYLEIADQGDIYFGFTQHSFRLSSILIPDKTKSIIRVLDITKPETNKDLHYSLHNSGEYHFKYAGRIIYNGTYSTWFPVTKPFCALMVTTPKIEDLMPIDQKYMNRTNCYRITIPNMKYQVTMRLDIYPPNDSYATTISQYNIIRKSPQYHLAIAFKHEDQQVTQQIRFATDLFDMTNLLQ